MDERRVEQRRRRVKPGRIIFNAMQSVMSCTLRDLSASGARLHFGESLGAPEEFLVSVPGEINKRYARRVWMSNHEIGIQFVG